MKISYIDHYDSFTNNVIDWVKSSDLKIEIELFRFDAPNTMERFLKNPTPLILSPGPGHPEEKIQTLEIIKQALGKVPILGICLGHQILGYSTGAKVVKSKNPLHGLSKKLLVTSQIGSLYSNWDGEQFDAGVYNSLIVDPATLGGKWHAFIKSDDREVYGIEYIEKDSQSAIGVQFHPDSFLSKSSGFILERWLRQCELWYRKPPKKIEKLR